MNYKFEKAMPDHVRPPIIIGCVMGYEWEEKGWIFGDNVIYRFIVDLINEGKILISNSYFEWYMKPPVLYKRGE